MTSGYEYSQGTVGSGALAADEVILRAEVLGVNPATGYHRKLQAGDVFAGHARREADATGKNDGDIRVEKERGVYYAVVDLPGVTLADVSKTVRLVAATHVYTLGAGEDIGTLHDVLDGKAVVRCAPTC